VRRERIDLIRIDVPDVRRGTNSEWLHPRYADEVARIASADRRVLSHVRQDLDNPRPGARWGRRGSGGEFPRHAASRFEGGESLIVRFFVPAADSDSMAEEVYDTLRRRVGAPPQKRRIWKLAWQPAQQQVECEIGQSLPASFGTEDDPVLAIFDTGSVYFICTIRRGAMGDDGPILVGYRESPTPTYFSAHQQP
jgi:hypothetical protein